MDHLSNVICGGIAGFAADALLYPLDTLKTRSQLERNLQIERRHMRHIPRYRSLYTGFFVLALGDVPSTAAFYGIYEFTKDVLNGDQGKGNGWIPLPVVHLLGSSCGQFCSLLIRNPFEVIKQQMQAGLYSTSYETFRSIRRTQGYKGLYAGFFPTLMREVPFDGIQFVLWERLKTLQSAKRFSQYIATKADVTNDTGDVVVSALCGSFAGGCAGIATVPLDVVKTRLMTQGSAKTYASATECARRIVREEGVRALFSGMWIRTAWITLGGFVFFATLELGKLKIRPVLRGEPYDSTYRNHTP
ncbi:Mitochondrial carrier family protein [Babesia bovis T2Bo]|uniref:Mitochondrial carrier protein, putative n=1 Tax=Babesia bovis TaxID=5865 RepID=S6CAL8_BABBO|nr:Mitochondrial carrier family protein [Babesia bovis T2Bo]KAG6439901.1 Mitochondrial carrier family protein [Babesia bovis T2Bo]BAN65920.1 mitochondrial carrier protein, putative [Babesia bovis]